MKGKHCRICVARLGSLVLIYHTLVYQSIISVEPGGDVTLTCEAPGRGTIIVVECFRTDLKDGYVLLYKDKLFDPDYQLQSYRDRVDLQIENRTISLILKNVSPDDEGTYECRVVQRNSPRQQRSVIYIYKSISISYQLWCDQVVDNHLQCDIDLLYNSWTKTFY
uniref:Ig-like domain-containing protein n=1 Tax=Gouania willdenowi TaxID=441366 RepID=A0A8C5DEP1_GOUWI